MKRSLLGFAVIAAGTLCFASAAHADLLLNYTFDAQNGADAVAPTANATPIGPNASFVADTPSGAGYAFSAGAGDNYLTTGTAAAPDTGGANDSKLNGLKSFTLTTWIDLQANPAQFDRLMSRQSTGGGPGFNLNFDLAGGSISAGNFSLALTVNGLAANATVTGQALNQWIFLAATYDGTASANNVAFYIGDATHALTQIGATTTLNQGPVNPISAPFQVAGTAASGSDRSPTALFDDVRVYGSASDATGALTGSQLEAVRSAAVAVPEPATLGMLFGAFGLLALRRRG